MEIENISFGQTIIKFEKFVGSLDAMLDHKIHRKKQVFNSCKRALSLLYRLNFFLKSATFELLFPSVLDYTALWYCAISLSNLTKKLHVIMNAGILYVYEIRKREHLSFIPFFFRGWSDFLVTGTSLVNPWRIPSYFWRVKHEPSQVYVMSATFDKSSVI